MSDFTVTLNVNAPDVTRLAEAILDLTVAIRNGAAPTTAKPAKSKAALTVVPPIVEEAPAAPVVDERESRVEPKPAAPTAAAPTIDQVRDAVKAFLKAKGRDATEKLLSKYQATSITALKPEVYASIIADAAV